jgi:ribosome recycling factor
MSNQLAFLSALRRAPYICPKCQFEAISKLLPRQPLPKPRLQRPFSHSSILFKKGGKQESKRTVEKATARVDSTGTTDPYDFSTLGASIETALARLKDELGKLRPGGRFNPDIVEALRVVVGKGEGGKHNLKLGDVAQVIPKGRTLLVLVGDADVS